MDRWMDGWMDEVIIHNRTKLDDNNILTVHDHESPVLVH